MLDSILNFQLPTVQGTAAPPAPGGLTLAPAAEGKVAEALGLGPGEALAPAVVGILLGLGIGWLLRKLYKYLFDINCWTETCTLTEDTQDTTSVVEHIPTDTPVAILQKTCDYVCDTPFGFVTDFLAEHIPGTPCPKKIVFRKCRYKGVVLVIWIEVDGVRKGLRPH